MKSRRHARGLTLVELLVSISIGLVVVGALVALYLSTARSYRQLEALGQLQSNARHVFEIMGYDIRMAGNMGCHVPGQSNPVNFINNYNAAQQWWSNTDRPLFGQDETSDSNATGDANYPQTAPGGYGPNALRGDTLIVLRANADESIGKVGSYDLSAVAIPFSDPLNKGFRKGSLLLLTDCTTRAAVFHKTGPADPSDPPYLSPIEHVKISAGNSTTSQPGNCKDSLAGTCAPGGSNQDMSGAKLLPLSANAYYLRNSGRKYNRSNSPIPSLYRQTLSTSGGAVATDAQELVSGVTDLQILYGVDTSTPRDGIVDSYMTAAAINAAGYSWEWTDDLTDSTKRRVLAVRVTVTLESQDDNVSNESRSTTLGNGTVITDRRLRRSYTMTFGLRQRLT